MIDYEKANNRTTLLVSKLSDIICTCLALDLANTAHFTDSVCINLAAVLIRLMKRKKEEIAQNPIAVFSTRSYHILTCIYTVFSHDKAHILKFRTLAFFTNVISKITNSDKNNYFLVFVILEHLPYI